MKEFPDYYERLELMEQEAERHWADDPGAGTPS
jgi:predicted N-formylglutamate amidohydrolase